MKVDIIGIMGRGGAGKDTLAEVLRDHLQQRVPCIRLSFAQPLYEMLSSMTGIPVRQLRDRQRKEASMPELMYHSPRYMLQTLGTEWGRGMVNPDVWIETMRRRINQLEGATHVTIIIPDVRFENEIEFVRSWPRGRGVVLGVRRSEAHTAKVREHASEVGATTMEPTLWVQNDGTIEDLHDAAVDALEALNWIPPCEPA